ncbi:MAG: 5-formyltetrahydrofolate cyclo-ligase [Chloroflexi bacterium]|nr:5-formyltetrahydrofolate cyclo-ligase [Chloroflexota bacterium]
MALQDKPHLRRFHTAYRNSLTREEVASASFAVCRQLASWPLFSNASTVLTYIAFRNEIDLSGLLPEFPEIQWAAPRIVERGMCVHAYDPTRLVRHPFGMMEPAKSLPAIAPEEIDLVFVPGLAFDRKGGRLGFGGGYYDRFLPTTRAIRIGITYDANLVDRLPHAEWDQRVHWIATPSTILRCSTTTSEPLP